MSLRAAPGRILVAEDQAVNRAVISRQLHRLGYPHSLVENGEQALQALASEHYDLLLTDCHMPLLDGYALARRIRASERGGSTRLPIVALSASSGADLSRRCGEAGMDGFLDKPVQLGELQRELARQLDPAGNGDAGPSCPARVPPPPCINDAPVDGPLRELATAFGSIRDARRALRRLLLAGRHDLELLDRAIDSGDGQRQRELLHRLDGALRLLGYEGDGIGPAAAPRERRDGLERQLEAIAKLLARTRASAPHAGPRHGHHPHGKDP